MKAKAKTDQPTSPFASTSTSTSASTPQPSTCALRVTTRISPSRIRYGCGKCSNKRGPSSRRLRNCCRHWDSSTRQPTDRQPHTANRSPPSATRPLHCPTGAAAANPRLLDPSPPPIYNLKSRMVRGAAPLSGLTGGERLIKCTCMAAIRNRFIVDEKGNRVSVVLPVDEY